MSAPPTTRRAERFTYGPLEIDEELGRLSCHYDLDGVPFVETVAVGAGRAWSDAAYEAARLVHLVAGVSYYKAGAALRIDLGEVVVRDAEREFLRAYYLGGLGEFAFRNGLDLDGLEISGGSEPAGPPPDDGAVTSPERVLVPFGGGIDSLVSLEIVERVFGDVALFVSSRPGLPFEAIERAASVTGREVVRVERELDQRLLAGTDPALRFNGHVPVTGILSACAVLAAVLSGRGTVVMSNEWSASQPNLVVGGRSVNHQYSKSAEFEDGFRSVLAGALGSAVDYFSLLRPFSELWVAERFASLDRYHGVVHSCNRAFHLEGSRRLSGWCGRCDKCCFIDLILSPFLGPAALGRIFGGAEPLEDPSLLPQFRALVGLADRKPFECVGDVSECRTAAVLAAAREDRLGSSVLAVLVDELGPAASVALGDAGRLSSVMGPHHVPDALLAAALLG